MYEYLFFFCVFLLGSGFRIHVDIFGILDPDQHEILCGSETLFYRRRRVSITSFVFKLLKRDLYSKLKSPDCFRFGLKTQKINFAIREVGNGHGFFFLSLTRYLVFHAIAACRGSPSACPPPLPPLKCGEWKIYLPNVHIMCGGRSDMPCPTPPPPYHRIAKIPTVSLVIFRYF